MMAIAWKEAVRSSLRAEKIAPARRCAPGRAFLALSVAPEPLNNNRSLSAPSSAALVLLPEGLAAVKAARADRLRTSLNLALGSSLATIGLTIPAVAALSIALRQPLELGLNAKEQVLLALTLLVSVITLGTGRTSVLQGIVHLLIFAVFLFFAVAP